MESEVTKMTDEALQEHLEPEQEYFLSRMADLENISISQVVINPESSSVARLNFGLKHIEQNHENASKKLDKRSYGVLVPKTKSTNRKRNPPSKSPSDENIENISDNKQKLDQQCDKLKPLASFSKQVPGKSSSINSISNSPILTSPVLESQITSTITPISSSLLPTSTLLSKSSSTISVPDLSSSSAKPSLSNLATLGNSVSSIPKLGGSTLQSSTKNTKFSIPALGSLAKSSQIDSALKSEGQGLMNTNTKFSIPAIGALSSLSQTDPATPNTSLKSLASQGLNSTATGSSFKIPELGSLGSSKTITNKSSGGTLPNLASLQISTSTGNEGPNSSLSALANLHLASEVPKDDTVDEVSRNKGSVLKKEVKVTEIEDVIDLTSALKTFSDEKIGVTKSSEDEITKSLPTKLLITDLTKLKSNLLKKECSSLGKVLSIRWRWKTKRDKIVLPTLFLEDGRFKFDEPSPDDVVLKAQTQSKSFLSRAKTASPCR